VIGNLNEDWQAKHDLSGVRISEKQSIDFEVIFHYWCHTPYPLLTQKMKYSGFFATNCEKFPGRKNLEKWLDFGRLVFKCLSA